MTDITNVSTSMSYDDRPFASGVITTQTSGSLCLEMEGPPSKESTESEIISNGLDPPMDTTQSTENSLESEIKTRTAIKISPLKIAYEMLTTGSLTVSGFLLWTARPHYLPRQQLIVPFQYISFFGSIIAWSIAGVAVFYEWQASKYAVVY
ncbi:Protein CBG22223 [Caenorhabditis briggsae]|uniref:Protein CBG22223 n=1 Tax=Caenorhabditis briggsae TaxID=6238 RepID=A8Y1U0_CAEBR|nr:Protein CBG22223 [Caenorhabditis briggsae]CAP38860.1 Protein CBG22223 [Caenorhabditis briggsae]